MMKRLKVAIGLGCQRGVSLSTLECAITEALRPLGAVEVLCIASHVRKADEAALLELIRIHDWRLQLFTAEELGAVQVPYPSAQTASKVGTPSVAEAAALLAADGAPLLTEKRTYRGPDGKGVTVATSAMKQSFRS